MGETTIQWTSKTWNPTRGCSLKSAGCTNCYAMKMAHRFSGPGQPYEGLTRLGAKGPTWTGKIRLASEMLDAPLKWRKPARIFVNSMSDLFHEDLPEADILAVFDVMRQCTWAGGQGCGRIGGSGHTFQILTKRPERMADFASRLDWDGERLLLRDRDQPKRRALLSMMDQIWLGTSVENQATADERIPHLLATPAAVRFLSVEPLLGPVDLSEWLFCDRCRNPSTPCGQGAYETPLDNAAGGCWFRECGCSRISWTIVGGESGPGSRPCQLSWIRSVVRQCRDAGTPVFVKQLGSKPYGEWLHGDPPTHSLSRYVGGVMKTTTELSQCQNGKWNLRDGKGGLMEEWPTDLRIREFPANKEV